MDWLQSAWDKMMLKHQPLISDVFSVEIGSEHLNQVQAKTTANCRIYYYLYIMHDYQYKFQVMIY